MVVLCNNESRRERRELAEKEARRGRRICYDRLSVADVASSRALASNRVCMPWQGVTWMGVLI